jgi:type I restriction enzyme M protein
MGTFTISTIFDKNRFFIVNLKQIEERLDPFFYKPKFRNLSQYKIQFQKLSLLAKSIHHPPEYERVYSENGYQLMRAQNVRPTGIEIDNNKVFFSEELLNGKNLIHPEIGDVLVVRSGVNAGDTAVIEKRYEKVIVGADNLLIKVNDKVIPKFLQVFFFTSFGKELMSRYLTGATNKHINPFNLGKIPIPIADIEKQKKAILVFENTLNQNKLFDLQAEILLSSIDEYLLKELGITLPTPPENTLNNRMFISKLKEISGNRIDPAFHQIYFHKLFDAITNSKFKSIKLGREIDEINYGASFNNDYVEEGVPLLRIKDLRRNEIIIDKVVYLPESSRNQLGNSFVKTNDLLISRSGTIGVVAIVKKEINGFAFGSFMIKFNLKNETVLNREYLSYYLNCKLLIDLIERDKIGAIQGNITIPIIRSLIIPLPPLTKQKEIADHITSIRQQAQKLKDKTKEALAQANKEIENILLST